MTGFHLTYSDTWTATAFALYDAAHFSNYQDISIARKFRDLWTVQANVIFISGAPDTPLGAYDKNDSVSLSLSRSY
jgi:hypothetical protein